MWYVAVYATTGAIVIFLLGMTKDFEERMREAGAALAAAEEEICDDGFAANAIVLGVSAVLLAAWPNWLVAMSSRRLRRRK